MIVRQHIRHQAPAVTGLEHFALVIQQTDSDISCCRGTCVANTQGASEQAGLAAFDPATACQKCPTGLGPFLLAQASDRIVQGHIKICTRDG